MKTKQLLRIDLILALLILVVNDYFLKWVFPSLVTGKLSDLAGLYLFPLFFALFFNKQKVYIYLLTAIGFVWFKSSYSTAFINSFNSLGIYSLNRVVDYTDLFALIVLPLSYFNLNNERWELTINYANFFKKIIAAACLFSFVATANMGGAVGVESYTYGCSIAELSEASTLFLKDYPQYKLPENLSEYKNHYRNKSVPGSEAFYSKHECEVLDSDSVSFHFYLKKKN